MRATAPPIHSGNRGARDPVAPTNRAAPMHRGARPIALVNLALAALLLFNLAGLAVYEFLTYRLAFHSDAAAKNLFAEQILRTHSLFPADWIYPYGDIMVFFGHLFILPLLPFFPNGFALHAVSGSIMAALLLVCVWWVTGLLSLSLPVRLLGLCLFSSGISPYFAESYYGQASYGPVSILLLLHAALAILAYDAGRRAELHRQRWIAAACALLAVISFTTNPERAIATFVLPLLAGAAALVVPRTFARRTPSRHTPYVMPILAYIAGAGVGVGLHAYILSRAVVVAVGVMGSLIPIEVLGERLTLAAQSLLYLFGAAAKPSTEIVSFTLAAGSSVAGLQGASLLLHLTLIFAIVGAGISLARAGSRNAEHLLPKGLANAFVASLLVTGFLYIFTSVGTNPATSRYFVPTFTLGFVVLLAFLDRTAPSGRRSIWTVVALVSVLGVSALSYESYLAPLYRSARAAGSRWIWPRNPADNLVTFLEQNGLTYGYASFWNSHVATVLSGGRVAIRPILFNTLPQAFYWLGAPSWYRPSTHPGPVFILVSSAEEAKAFDLSEMQRAAGSPERVLKHGGYTIYVYEHNFSPPWMGWDPLLQDPALQRFSAKTPHTVGAYVPDASRDGWMQSGRGEAGVLAYGPYITLRRGRYVAEFDVSTCGPDASSPGSVDVSGFADGKPVELSSREIPSPAGWNVLSVPFTLVRDTDGMEFRVLPSGSGCLRAKSVTVRRDG